MNPPTWEGLRGLNSRSFDCAYCGNLVASSIGVSAGGAVRQIYICPHCGHPSYFYGDAQIPGVAPGKDVAGVPEDIDKLYREARKALAAGAPTSSVLACRKLLMNVAVSQGATEGLRFVEYVDFLAGKGFVPPNGRGWVDHIRKKGNEATHEIRLMLRSDADELITFAEMLLKFVYEFPSRVPPVTPTP